jgi:Lrp/AsnC family leucine-responsive transcriptional regulator
MDYILDDLDKKLLNLIQQDARISERQLAVKVFRSPPNVHARLVKLEQGGFIKKYITLLDRAKVGIPMLAETHVKLERQNKTAIEAFEQRISAVPQVQFCCHLAGKWDFVIFIAVKDPQAYNDWLMGELTNWPDVKNIESSFVLKEIKSYGPLEL